MSTVQQSADSTLFKETELAQQDQHDSEVVHHHGGNMPSHGHHDEEVVSERDVNSYWKANLSLLGKLLCVWFVVSFGFGILLVDVLNQIPLFGFKMGFWWAQQGSIYVFVGIIFYYVHKMKHIDREHGVDDDED